jgi:hypothetical protein
LVQTFNAATDPKAKGLYKALTQYNFLALLNFLVDLIPHVTVLNLKFQKEDLDVSMIAPNVNILLNDIAKLKEGSPLVSQLDEELTEETGQGSEKSFFYKNIKIVKNASMKEQFKKSAEEFCSNLEKNIRKRFPNETMDMTNATVVLKMDGIGLLSKDAVQSYGNAQIEKLLDHFSQYHEGFEPVVEKESTIAEWKLVKQVVFEHKHLYANESMKALWQQLIHAHKGTFPQMTCLAQMALIFPLQTATCERGFSVQNIIS